MIKGTGIDIIELKRIKKAMERPGFLNKIFTDNEIEEYKKRNCNLSYLAGLFAAKEAFSKALGTGMKGIWFTDIEILNDKNGKPYINLLKDLGISNDKIHITISHSKENAISMCIIEK